MGTGKTARNLVGVLLWCASQPALAGFAPEGSRVSRIKPTPLPDCKSRMAQLNPGALNPLTAMGFQGSDPQEIKAIDQRFREVKSGLIQAEMGLSDSLPFERAFDPRLSPRALSQWTKLRKIGIRVGEMEMEPDRERAWESSRFDARKRRIEINLNRLIEDPDQRFIYELERQAFIRSVDWYRLPKAILESFPKKTNALARVSSKFVKDHPQAARHPYPPEFPVEEQPALTLKALEPLKYSAGEITALENEGKDVWNHSEVEAKPKKAPKSEVQLGGTRWFLGQAFSFLERRAAQDAAMDYYRKARESDKLVIRPHLEEWLALSPEDYKKRMIHQFYRAYAIDERVSHLLWDWKIPPEAYNEF